ncbi:hypothetical protein [Nocardia sp. NPDC052112]|uniref:hypothetical protein n=1 Tax=Nocardia sp. NPDC052112 TaxID=3155646 RepID=UPI0034428630
MLPRGWSVAYAYLDTGSDRVRAAFGPARTILAISIPIWLVIGILLLVGGIQLSEQRQRRRTSGLQLIAAPFETVRRLTDLEQVVVAEPERIDVCQERMIPPWNPR